MTRMPMPKLPEVRYGKNDALEYFMADYLVGMFDHAAPLIVGPVVAAQVDSLLLHKSMTVQSVRLPANGELHTTADVDLIEFDLFMPTQRVIDGHALDAPAMIGMHAVRIAAGTPCTRKAGPIGAAWLSFRGTA